MQTIMNCFAVPPPFSEILDPPVVYIVIVTLQAAIPLEDDSFMQFS